MKKKVGEVYSCPEVELEGEFFLGQLTEVDMIERNPKETWKAEVKLNEHAVTFKVDTGADVTVIPPNMYHSLVPKPSLSKCDKTLMALANISCIVWEISQPNSVSMRKFVESSSTLLKILRDRC